MPANYETIKRHVASRIWQWLEMDGVPPAGVEKCAAALLLCYEESGRDGQMVGDVIAKLSMATGMRSPQVAVMLTDLALGIASPDVVATAENERIAVPAFRVSIRDDPRSGPDTISWTGESRP